MARSAVGGCAAGGFLGVSWTLAAWCEARDEFRNFRIDRMLACTPLADTFTPASRAHAGGFFGRWAPASRPLAADPPIKRAVRMPIAKYSP